MIKAVFRTITDGPVGKQGCKAFSAGVYKLVFTGDIEKRLLLAGETGLGKIFGRGAAANGDVHFVGVITVRQGFIGVGQGFAYFIRKGRRMKQPANGLAGLFQGLFLFLQRFEMTSNLFVKIIGPYKFPVGVGGGGKPVGNTYAFVLKAFYHFTQRSIFTTDPVGVIRSQFFKPDHVLIVFSHWKALHYACYIFKLCRSLDEENGVDAVFGQLEKGIYGPSRARECLPKHHQDPENGIEIRI